MSSDLIRIIAPLVFIFAIVYGSLDISGMFKKNQGVNVIISLIIAIISVSSEAVIDLTWKYMPIASIIFAIAFIIGFLWKLMVNFSSDFSTLQKNAGMDKSQILGMAGVIIFMLFIGLNSDTMTNIFRGFGIGKNTLIFISGAVLIAILFFIANSMGIYGKGGSS